MPCRAYFCFDIVIKNKQSKTVNKDDTDDEQNIKEEAHSHYY